MKKTVLQIGVLFWAGTVCGQGTVQVPFPPIPGADSGDVYPLLVHQVGHTSARYQQIYSASAFSSLDPGGANITSLIFLMDNSVSNRGFGWTISSMAISLSTTTNGVDSLNPVFSMNLGADNQTVFGPGSRTFSVIGPGAPIQIDMTQPFFYNPALGNLLLDVHVFSDTWMADINNPYLDAQGALGDAVSRLWSADVNAITGAADSIGLRTSFVTQRIPEPGSLALIVVGATGLLVLARERRKGS